MKTVKKLLLAGTTLTMSVSLSPAAHAQSGPNDRADKVLKHWTAERISAAEPRDMLLDHRGKAYIRGKKGKLTPHGHTIKSELTSDTKRVNGNQNWDAQVTQDNQAPVVTSRTPANGAEIGASQTFSAVVTDVDGVREVTFEVIFNGEVSTFAGVDVGNNTWQTTVSGFTAGSGSWRVLTRDNAKRRGGNRGATNAFNFTVDGGGSGGGGGGGVVANTRWAQGGAIQTAAGRLLYEMPNNGGWSGYVCSGTVATDGTTGRSIIITAAHCVYDDADAAFARNVIFIPNQDQTTGSSTDRDCSNDPEGCWVSDFGVVEQNWTTSVFPNNIPWDYAYYVVGDNGNHSGNGTGGALDSAVGSFDIDFSAPNVNDGQNGEFSSDWTHALGYSYSDDPFFMYSAEDMTTEGDDNWWLASSQLSGGSSGGPWIQPMDEATGTGPWDWSFGDGSSSTAQNPSYTYATAGTYTVNLVVTDNEGASSSSSSSVTVSDGSTGGGDNVTLAPVRAYKVKGKKRWDYSWSGAASSNVDIYLDGTLTATTANDGAYTLTSNSKGGGTHSHQVCEEGTSSCSWHGQSFWAALGKSVCAACRAEEFYLRPNLRLSRTKV